MGLQKFGDAVEAEVFRGKEAEVVNEALAKTGKAVSDFDENELASLRAKLAEVQEDEPKSNPVLVEESSEKKKVVRHRAKKEADE